MEEHIENSSVQRRYKKFFRLFRILVVISWILSCCWAVITGFLYSTVLVDPQETILITLNFQEPILIRLSYQEPIWIEWGLDPLYGTIFTILITSVFAAIALFVLSATQNRLSKPVAADNTKTTSLYKDENQPTQSSKSDQKNVKESSQSKHLNLDLSDIFSGFVASFIICSPIVFFCFCINPIVGWISFVALPIMFTKVMDEDKASRKEQEERINKLRVQSAIMQFQNERQYGAKSTNSPSTIDTNRLRKDMMNYYGTAMHSGSPMAQADLIHVQRASDTELIREAQKSGFDLNKYTE